MALKITEQKDNSLLKRKEIKGVMHADKNPSFEDVKTMLSEQLKADKELIVVKKIKGEYGSDEFSIRAIIYQTKKDLDETEIITKKAHQAKLKPAALPAAEQPALTAK